MQTTLTIKTSTKSPIQNMTTLQSQIKQLHQSLVENFRIIRSENDEIFSRLEKIEKSLDKDKEDHSKDDNKDTKTFRKSDREKIVVKTAVEVDNNESVVKKETQKAKVQQKTDKKKKKKNTKVTKIEANDNSKEDSNEEEFDGVQLYDELSLNLAADETLEENGSCLDDGKRHDVEVKTLPEKVFEGFCFRPIAGWKNPDGDYEISKEIIEFAHKLVNNADICYN